MRPATSVRLAHGYGTGGVRPRYGCVQGTVKGPSNTRATRTATRPEVSEHGHRLADMAGRRLSQRMGGVGPDGPYEGVPGHMRHALTHWFDGQIRGGPQGYRGHEVTIRDLASFMRMDVEPGWNADVLARAIIAAAEADDDFFLDLVDGVLQRRGNQYNGQALRQVLDTAGSVWTVAEDYHSLIRVVSDDAQATYDIATSVADEITTEMREAWTNAFGRDGDPSDAWDHAIKALEDLLITVVVPNQTKPNLGHVVGQLRNQGSAWKLVLPGKDQDHDVAPLVGMLDLVWPNHDRHGGPTPKRTPSEPEARAVVTLAATIVQWHREGWVVQQR